MHDRDHEISVNVPTPTEDISLADLQDVELLCIDCSSAFTWSAGEQSFYAAHQLANPPKRCKPCKRAKTQRIAAIEESKKTGAPAKIVIEVNCDRCECLTTVPFYPSQGRPVYCRDCYSDIKQEATNAAGV